MTTIGALLIKLNIREDGDFFYASSPDLLGLHVCGSSVQKTCDLVEKAIKAIFKHSRGIDVSVLPVTTDKEFPSMKMNCEQLVIQQQLAA